METAGGTHYARTAGVKWILPLILQVSLADFLKVTQQEGWGATLGLTKASQAWVSPTSKTPQQTLTRGVGTLIFGASPESQS